MKFPNTELFLEVYKKHLINNVKTKPEIYTWDISELEVVFKRMKDAIERGNFNKDSETFKQTCKELKIKHTYRDIESFLKGGV